MRFRRLLGIMAFGATALFVVGYVIFVFELRRFEKKIADNIARKDAWCATTLNQCRDDMIVARAEAISPSSLYLSDFQGEGRRYGNRNIVQIWGISTTHNALNDLYARAAVTDLLHEYGPWVACWERSTGSFSCSGLGQTLPAEMPVYNPSTDIALKIIENGFAGFFSPDGIKPMPTWAFAPEQPPISLSGLYLNAAIKSGAR